MSEMRRQPRQARSQQRVDHILDVAAELFNQQGYDAVTTNAIAEAAGIPIGSLYQFFKNKQAIMDALVDRYVTQLRELYDRTLTPEVTHGLSIPEFTERFLLAMAEFEASHAAFRPIFLSTDLAIKADMHLETLNRVEQLIASRYPSLPAERCRTAATVMTGIFKGLMTLTAPPDNLSPPIVRQEISRALLAYLRQVVQEAGLGDPTDRT